MLASTRLTWVSMQACQGRFAKMFFTFTKVDVEMKYVAQQDNNTQ